VLPALGIWGSSFAQIYKWVDAQGVTHYSQSPPAPGQGKAQVLNVPDAATATTPGQGAADQNWQEKDREFRERQAKAADLRRQAEEKAERDEAQRHRACQQARAAVDQLTRQGRIFNVNEKGERVYLSDDDRARGLQDANQQVAQYCGS
jgi:hypothetical protein